MMDMITPYRNLSFFGETEREEKEEMYSSKLYFVCNLLLFALSRRDTMAATRVT